MKARRIQGTGAANEAVAMPEARPTRIENNESPRSETAEQIGSIVHLFDPVAYVGSLLRIVAACVCAALIPALRAGRIDPAATLRLD